jgi:hypothetical protein
MSRIERTNEKYQRAAEKEQAAREIETEVNILGLLREIRDMLKIIDQRLVRNESSIDRRSRLHRLHSFDDSA